MNRCVTCFFLVTTALAICAYNAVAQVSDSSGLLHDNLVVDGSLGSEFWVAVAPNNVWNSPANDLQVHVSAIEDAVVELSYAGSPITTTRRVMAGAVEVFSVLHGDLLWSAEVWEAQQAVPKGIRIISSKPVSVSVINSKVYSSDSYLAIPTSNWDTAYIPCAYYDFNEGLPWAGGFMVIAKDDSTRVTIKLRGTGSNEAKTSARYSIGSIINVTLMKGEVYRVAGDATTRGIFDLTGSLITADHPIGVLSYHERTTMPNQLENGNGRNHLVEMNRGITQWGTEYATMAVARGTKEGLGSGDVFRIVASQDLTKWAVRSYDPETGKLIIEDGGVLTKAGDFADIKQSTVPTNLITGFSHWQSDKPVHISQYACSQSWTGDTLLDPFMVNLQPVKDGITESIFLFPRIGDLTRHYVNLVVWADTADPKYEEHIKSITVDNEAIWSHPAHIPPNLLASRIQGTNLHFAAINLLSPNVAHHLNSDGAVRITGYQYGLGMLDAYGQSLPSISALANPVDTVPPQATVDTVRSGGITFAEVVNSEVVDSTGLPAAPLSGIAYTKIFPTSDNFRIIDSSVVQSMGKSRRMATVQTMYRLAHIDTTKPMSAMVVCSDNSGNVRLTIVSMPALTSVVDTTTGPDPDTTGPDTTTHVVVLAEHALRIYPNPARDLATIVSMNTDIHIHQVILRSLQGALVQRVSGYLQDNARIDLAGLPPGLYLVEVQTTNGTWKSTVTVE